MIEHLKPIQERFHQYMSDKEYLAKCYNEGAEKAERIARKTLSKVMRKIGFVPRG